MLDAAPFVGFLALEEDAAMAGANSSVWRTPSGGVLLSLVEVLAYAPSGGELLAGPPPHSLRLPANVDPVAVWPEIPAGCCPCCSNLLRSEPWTCSSTGHG